MLVAAIIDHTPSELQLESEALTWWRSSSADTRHHGRNRKENHHNQGHNHNKLSSIRQLVKQLSSTSMDQLAAPAAQEAQQLRTSCSILTTGQLAGSAGTQPINKKRKCIEFSQIVGLVKVGSRSRKCHWQRHVESSSSNNSNNNNDNDNGHANANKWRVKRLKVYFAEKSQKSSGRLLKLKKLVIELPASGSGSSSSPGGEQADKSLTLSELHDLIERNLELRRRQRPRRLLIFVNPYGGKGKAVQLYEKKVKRILELGQIECELLVTQYANHARQTLEDPAFDVDAFDGIICIGGDGMFAELMNGLLFRANRGRLALAKSSSAGQEQLQKQQQRTNLNSSMELDSIAASSSSAVSTSGDDSSATTLDDADAQHCDEGPKSDNNSRTRKVILKEENNNNEDDDDDDDDQETCSRQGPKSNAAAPGSTRNGIKPSGQSFQQQFEFLRSSLGGIGERFQSPGIPIGVIGAGSTDANLFGFIGTNDPITATLNIVLGNQIQIDVGSVHSIQDDRLLRFVSTFVAYGYFGDVVRESEKLRWLGPSRYDLTAVNSLIKYRDYEGLVRILSSPRDGSPRDPNRCQLDCSLCQNQISNSLSFNDFSHLSRPSSASEEGELERVRAEHQARLKQQALHDLDQFEMVERRGPFVGVNAAVTACRCPQTRKGFSPGNHLANGCADLILVRPCSRLQYINYLLRTGYTNKSAFDLKYVEAYRCRQFEFIVGSGAKVGNPAAAEQPRDRTPSSGSASGDDQSTTLGYGSMSTIKESSHESGDNLPSTAHEKQPRKRQTCLRKHRRPDQHDEDQQQQQWSSSWNADGEILTEQSIRVKVNNKLLRVFGTGEPAIQGSG